LKHIDEVSDVFSICDVSANIEDFIDSWPVSRSISSSDSLEIAKTFFNAQAASGIIVGLSKIVSSNDREAILRSSFSSLEVNERSRCG